MPAKNARPATYITTAEAAKLIGVTTRQVRELLKAGTLKGRKPAGPPNRADWRVLKSSAIAYSNTERHPGRKAEA